MNTCFPAQHMLSVRIEHCCCRQKQTKAFVLCARAGTEYQAPGIKHLWWVAPSTTSWRFRVVPGTPNMFSFRARGYRVHTKHVLVSCRCRRKQQKTLGFFLPCVRVPGAGTKHWVFFLFFRAGAGPIH
nr:MAG: hypothetical protein [Molluscum contagiosum virus]WQH58171.1 MAG: hypothetical protein [Molluscum contagiosum virus]